jgi:hypothetical protein
MIICIDLIKKFKPVTYRVRGDNLRYQGRSLVMAVFDTPDLADFRAALHATLLRG